MSLFTILMIAIGLSMDSFSVSLSSGIFLKRFQVAEVMKIAFVLAAFQAGMTSLGWALGIHFSDHIKAIDHWIAFLLLGYMGCKMIYEGYKQPETEDEPTYSTLSNKTILTLGFATSIDALAVGVGMAFLNSDILLPSFVIFFTTLLFSITGLFLGSRFGRIQWMNIELVGGLILIAIGSKILLEHTVLQG